MTTHTERTTAERITLLAIEAGEILTHMTTDEFSRGADKPVREILDQIAELASVVAEW